MYAALMDEVGAVEQILEQLPGHRRDHILNCRTFPKRTFGYISLPPSLRMSALHIAMLVSSTEIVTMLLDSGANPYILNKTGENPFVWACASGRIDNMEVWMKRFPSHDLHHRNKVTGGFTLSTAVFAYPNSLKTFEFLLRHGAKPNLRLLMGLSVLQAAASNNDVDLRVVKKILEETSEDVNYRIAPLNSKWKFLYSICNRMYRWGLMSNAFTEFFAPLPGATCLHLAVAQGDVDFIEILLNHGANPLICDGLGRTAFDLLNIYGPFPKIFGLMQRASSFYGGGES